MNASQAQVLLDKINSLFRTLSGDLDAALPIERDLMKSYLQQFYAYFLQEKSTPTPVKQEEPTSVPSTHKTAYQPPRIIEIPETLKQLRREEKASKPQARPVAPPPTPRSTQPEPAPVRDSRLSSLFEVAPARELSDKLSTRPVEDLARSLTINDRLLYQNTLFEGNNPEFQRTLMTLNGFSSMEEAEPALYDLAGKYNWMDPEKQGVAKGFIKLVRRRYL